MNLPENTTYNNSIGTRLPNVDLSGLVKNIQDKTSEKVQSSLFKRFNPEKSNRFFTPARSRYNKPQEVKLSDNFKTGRIIGEQQYGKTEPIPGYAKFVEGYEGSPWSTPSDQAVSRNIPTNLFGGGQYTIDPTQKGALIKSKRVLVNPSVRKQLLGDRSSLMYEIEHNVPLWLGGSDSLANISIIYKPKHKIKTAVQSVPLTLLVNDKINLNQAKMMALTWESKDSKGLPQVDEYGYVPLKVAEKYAKKWEEDNKKVDTSKYFKSSFVESMRNFGKNIPVLGEFSKGLVGGATAGIVQGTEAREESGTLGTISNVAGNIAGTITGLGVLSKGIGLGIKGAKSLLGFNKKINIAKRAMKTAGLADDIGSLTKSTIKTKKRSEMLKKMASSAGLLSLWGQVGLSGREAFTEEDADLGNHMSQFFTDVAFGGLLGSAGQSIRGYATIGSGTFALSFMSGDNTVDALQNTALMVALHGLGYKKGMVKDNIRIGEGEAFKMASTAINQYSGNIIPRIKVGGKIPEILKIEPIKIEKLKNDYKLENPNDVRFDNMSNIDSGAAIQILGRNSRKKFMSDVIKADGKIPTEEIKKELRRITVAENTLYNQTLPIEARVQKEIQDLLSVGKKLNPQLNSEQLRYTTNTTKLLNEVPFEMPKQIFENPKGIKFLEGPMPSKGYGGKVSITDKKVINDISKNPQKYSKKLFIVKEPSVSKILRLVEQEQMTAYRAEKVDGNQYEIFGNDIFIKKVSPDKLSQYRLSEKKLTSEASSPDVGNPNDGLKVYAKTIDGNTHPAGFAPRKKSFDVDYKYNVNKDYYLMTKRVRTIIEKSKSAEDLKKSLNKDKSKIYVNDVTAKKIYESKERLNEITDEQLYSILKPQNALIKYNHNLNNSNISKEMDKHGLKVLVVDIKKVLSIGGKEPRSNPDNPYLSLNLNEQDWLRSIALKNKTIGVPKQTTAPIQETVINSAPVGPKLNVGESNIKKGINIPVAVKSILKDVKSTKKVDDLSIKNLTIKNNVKNLESLASSNSKTNTISLSDNITKDKFIKYIEGDIKTPAGKQKKHIIDNVLKKEEVSFLKGLNKKEDIKQFLVGHEKSHLINKDHISYPIKKNKIDLMSKKAIEIETRAIRDSITSFKKSSVVKGSKNKRDTIRTKPDLAQDLFAEMTTRIDYTKPDITSAAQNEKQLIGIINRYRSKNPGLPELEYKNILSDSKGRAKAYARDVIDNRWRKTELFGTDIKYKRKKESENRNVLLKRYNNLIRKTEGMKTQEDPGVVLSKFEKIELKDLKNKIIKYVKLDKKVKSIRFKVNTKKRELTVKEENILKDLNEKKFTLTQDYRNAKDTSRVIANKFGLKLTKPNESGIQYLEFNKGKVVFNKEFAKTHKDKTPEDIYGSFLTKEIDVYKSNLSKTVKEWSKGIDKMKKSKDPYAKAFADAFDIAMGEKYNIVTNGKVRFHWKENWKANSAISKITRDLFETTNLEGYSKTEPFRTIAAKTIGGKWDTIKKEVAKAYTKTKEITSKAELSRLERILSGGKEVSPQEFSTLSKQKISSEDIAGLRVKDPTQFMNVLEDITPFDLMMNGLSKREVRNKLINQYNSARKEMDLSSSNVKSEIFGDMKLLFNRIKALSQDMPDEIKKWKVGSKIKLKNEGAPSAEEGIKDAMNVASKIFQAKKSPRFVKYENVRKKVLERLYKKTN